VQNLLNDLGDVGRQAQVNTTMASDGHGVDISIDFGNVNQVLEQQDINERFRSIGRMLTRLKLRIDHIEQIIESNFRLSPSAPPPTSVIVPPPILIPPPPPPPQPTSVATQPVADRPASSPTCVAPSTTTSTTFLGMEDITATEMDVESQGSIQSTEILHTPSSTTSTTPVDNGSTSTTSHHLSPSTPYDYFLFCFDYCSRTNVRQDVDNILTFSSSFLLSRTARDLAELMNTINIEQNRLQTHYRMYLNTITQSEPFVSPINEKHVILDRKRLVLGYGTR
jgi:hypothetical protein